jgi:hypothetical protein
MTGLVNAFGFVLTGTALAALVLVPLFGVWGVVLAWLVGPAALILVAVATHKGDEP